MERLSSNRYREQAKYVPPRHARVARLRRQVGVLVQLADELLGVDAAKDDDTAVVSGGAAEGQAEGLRVGDALLGQLVDQVVVLQVVVIAVADAADGQAGVVAGKSNAELDRLE